MVYTLENRGEAALDYTVGADQPWVSIAPAGGTLAGGGTVEVTVSFGAAAEALGNGLYQATVSFVNTTDHDGDTTRPVTLDIGIPEVQYEWPLDEDPGWTTEGEWAYGKPSGGGGEHGSRDPTGAHTGDNVYGYNLAGDYTNGMAEQSLTSGAIDCSSLTKVSVQFWRWLGVEQSQYDHAYLRVSTDGETWTTVWQNSGEIADSAWTEQEVDISALADGQSTVYLRWTMGSTDEGWIYCGWNLDDISIWGLGSPTCPDGDQDGFLSDACGGDDCDDGAYDVRPNATEDCDDGIDNDCDEAVDGDDSACGGGEPDAGPDDGDDGGTNPSDGDGGDCGCRVGGQPDPGAPLGGLLLCLGLALLVRRRRS
jgi:MYXO-CTERM domain-containing protein